MGINIIIFSIFCAVSVIANSIRTRTGVNSSQLESKIVEGFPAMNGEYRYMASLQVNNFHICSSSLIKQGFLMTTAECSIYIANCVHKEKQKGTAVLGHQNLKKGQKVDLLRFAYSSNCLNYISYENVGVVMFEGHVDYTDMKFLDLYPTQTDLRIQGSDATVCGWGHVIEDDQQNIFREKPQYSEDLHCMLVKLKGPTYCRRTIKVGKYHSELICGLAKLPWQKISSGDVGSPVTKFTQENGEKKNYIIGITLPRFNDKKEMLFRFLRSSFIVKYVQEAVEVLEAAAAEEATANSTSRQVSTDEPEKGRRVW